MFFLHLLIYLLFPLIFLYFFQIFISSYDIFNEVKRYELYLFIHTRNDDVFGTGSYLVNNLADVENCEQDDEDQPKSPDHGIQTEGGGARTRLGTLINHPILSPVNDQGR